MKRLLLSILLASVSVALADVVQTNTTSGSVVFTNAQANQSWTPVAAAIVFPSSSTGTVSIYRQGGGLDVLLSSSSFAGVTHSIWVPSASYQFPLHSALVVTSSVASFHIQLHREPSR